MKEVEKLSRIHLKEMGHGETIRVMISEDDEVTKARNTVSQANNVMKGSGKWSMRRLDGSVLVTRIE